MLAGVLVGLAAVTACTGDPAPVPVPSPRPTGPVVVPTPVTALGESARAACARLVAALPDEIDPGVERRPVSGDGSRTAAWGEPAVVLVCGAPPGDPAEQPAGVNGVMWSVRDIGPGFRWTTLDRAVVVAVDIPDSYANGAELVNPLATPIKQALPAA